MVTVFIIITIIIIIIIIFIFYFIFSCGAAAQRGPWPPHSWGFLITNKAASQSVGLLWTSDQPVAETSIWQHTHNTHNRQTSMSPGGIRTHDLSRRAAADLRLRPRGYWDRLIIIIVLKYLKPIIWHVKTELFAAKLM